MNLFDGVKSFLFENFWLPVIDPSVYYNPYNTIVYALLFGLAAIYLGFPLLKKFDISLNREFFIGIAPFVFLGGFARALRDLQVLDTFLLETPFIYIVMFLFTVSALFVSLKLEQLKDIEYHKTFFSLGGIALLSSLPFYSIQRFDILASFFFISFIWAGAGYIILKQFKPELLNWSFTIPIAAHFFDASSTYVGITMAGAEEKHVLADTVMQSVGPSGIFLVKAAIIIPVVYIIYNDYEDEKRNYYLFLVALLGFAITTRNMLTII